MSSSTAAVLTPNAMAILEKRYLDGGTVNQMWDRVSGGNEVYRELMSSLRFCPASPVLFNLDKNNNCTSAPCFVFDVSDQMARNKDGSFDWNSIMGTKVKAAEVAKAGGGVGYYLGFLRPKGSPIKTVHRRACGPVAVLKDYQSTANLITQGGKRELAQMGTLPCYHDDIDEFIHLKDDDPQGMGAFNISVSWTDEWLSRIDFNSGPNDALYTNKETKLWWEQCKSAWKTGCPGMYFFDTANTNNPNTHLGYYRSGNPCQPAFATVLTPTGISTIGSVQVGDTIWSGQRWTKVTRKVFTGNKHVFEYKTTAGRFVGTPCHQVFSNGERVYAGNADTIDTCCGPEKSSPEVDGQDVVDGWVIGDGMFHKASNKSFLCLGVKDGDFHDVLSEYVIKHRAWGESTTVWEVETTVTKEELPHTYHRQVPERFYNGSRPKAVGFLRGLYAANGSVCGNRVTLKATSFQLICQVQEMLSSVGITSYYTTNKATAVKHKNGVYVGKQSYDLNISTDRRKFRELIGFIQQDKQDRLNTICEQTSVRKKSSYEVLSSKHLGKMPVWDITVEADEHSYWTGGLLVSNCSEAFNRNNGVCSLGSLVLARYFKKASRSVDWKLLEQDTWNATFFIDNILDRNQFPHPDITTGAHLTKRLGLGVMGWADLLGMMHIHYDTEEALHLARKIMKLINEVSIAASVELGKQKGPYEGYNAVKTQAPMRRNEVNTCIAPCGTIGLITGCNGAIEPHFALGEHGNDGMIRTTAEGMKLQDGVQEEWWNQFDGFIPKTADQISPEWHVRMLAAWQENCQQGISKTANMPNSATIEDVSKAYRMLWETKCKGGTIFRDGCRSEQVLVKKKTSSVYQTGLSSDIISPSNPVASRVSSSPTVSEAVNREILSTIASTDDMTPLKERKKRRKCLPDELPSIRLKIRINDFKCYLHVGLDESGQPMEIFLRGPKLGSTISGLMDHWAMSFSMLLQHGVPLEQVCNMHKGARFEPAGLTSNKDIKVCSSPIDFVSQWLLKRFVVREKLLNATIPTETVLAAGNAKSEALSTPTNRPVYTGDLCPECQGPMISEGSCQKCIDSSCNFTRCG